MDSRERRIYVGNLSKLIRPSDLYDHFIKCGKISQIFYKEPPYAFIEFESADSAVLAIKTLNMSVISNRTIFVKEFFKKCKKSDKKLRHKGTSDNNDGTDETIDMKKFFTKHYDYCGHNSILNENGVNGSSHKSCCMIIIDKRDVLSYAENVSKKLSNLGISNEVDYVDLNLPRDLILQRLYIDGYYFAVFINDSNVNSQSFTVFTLRGMRIEHKNVPLDAGLKLIFKIYHQIKLNESTAGLPENISNFINKLINNEDLTVTQYNVLISYLKDKKKEQKKIEIGNLDFLTEKFENSVFEELFKKVLSALDRVIDRLVRKQIQTDENVAENRQIEELIVKVLNDRNLWGKLGD
ncbi:uncharacterized protein [Chironomus tepperi]|uniref:uncharacterized protein n=1 Tax=Chironomus tepperi TaxID=113505 RepID=UPI00391FA8C3